MAKKIPYNKEKSTMSSVRDLQRRQAEKGTATIKPPSIDLKEELKRLLAEQKKEEGPISLDGLGLSYEEAEKKIRQAVKATEETERKRYESGLRNLNDQLNDAKRKTAAMEELVINRNAEIAKLKAQIIEDPVIKDQVKEKIEELNKMNIELVQIKAQLETKDEFLEKFINNYINSVDELRAKISELDGKIPKSEFSDLMKTLKRPEIQDHVFIDPIEKENKLDSHIKIEADVPDAKRNVKNDLAKLKNLLNK